MVPRMRARKSEAQKDLFRIEPSKVTRGSYDAESVLGNNEAVAV